MPDHQIPLNKIEESEEIRESLDSLAKFFVESLKSIPTVSTSKIYLNYLTGDGETIANLIAGLKFKDDEEKTKLTNFLNSVPGQDDIATEDAVNNFLLRVCNLDDTNRVLKKSLFTKLEERSKVNLLRAIKKKIEDKEDLTTLPLPKKYNYIVTPTTLDQRITALRALKSSLKQKYTDTVTELKAKYPDQKVSELTKEHEEIKKVRSKWISSADLESPFSTQTEADNLTLAKLAGTETSFTVEEEFLMKIELLRILREKLNLELSEVLMQKATEDQRDPSKNINGLRRRIAAFEASHFGLSLNNEGNYQAIPKVLRDIDTVQNGGDQIKIPIKTEIFEWDPETSKKIESLSANLEIILTEEKGDFSSIAKAALKRLKLLSSEEEAQAQIEAYRTKKPITSQKQTYAIYLADAKTGMAVNKGYRVLIIPNNRNAKLLQAMGRIAHEITHVTQNVASQSSNLPGLNKLTGYGRSEITAETGAIKADANLQAVFDVGKVTTLLQYELLKAFTKGKSYLEIFQLALDLKTTNTNGDDEEESTTTQDKAQLVDDVYRSVERLYNNLGETSASSQKDPKDPSNYLSLRYVLQGIEPYSSLPDLATAVPSHRALEFEPFFRVEGSNQVTTQAILKAVIEATYDLILNKQEQI